MEKCSNKIEFYSETIAENLRHLRADKHLKISNIIQKVGIDRATLKRYENGNFFPNIQKLIKLSEIYEVPLDYFFTSHRENLHNQKEPL